MKKTKYIFLLFILFLTTCEKEKPEIPAGEGNKITITESQADNVTYREAIVSCSIEELIDKEIEQHGFCWDTASDPALTDSKVELGKLTETSFQDTMSGLTPGTKYYVKSYLICGENTVYGTQFSFTTVALGLPVLTTTEVTNITTKSATSGGNITDDNGSAITARGVCWNTNVYPTISNQYSIDGEGTGTFSSLMSGLSPNTEYYVRAYASNSVGVTYGNQVVFTTDIDVPTVTTSAVSSIHATTAACGGNVTDDGGSSIIACGVCYGTAENPTLSDSYTTETGTTGSFTSSLSGLTPNTTYYIRAYASNSSETGYGEQVGFKTYAVMDYDANGYYAVIIGNQEWMTENLKTIHYADGTALIDGTGAGDITGDYLTKYYFANSDDENLVSTYGRLYTWAAIMNDDSSSNSNPSGVQGICPAGWHVPSDAEWMELEIYLGMSSAEANALHDRGTDEGGKLKSVSYFWDPNTGATNSSGFNAIPAGGRGPDGGFGLVGSSVNYWSSTESYSAGAYVRGLQFDRSTINRWGHFKNYGFSVRCVKD